MNIWKIAMDTIAYHKGNGLKPYKIYTLCYGGMFYEFELDSNGDINYPNRMFH